MAYKIEKVGVLGAGVMGAGIAAHLANAGLSVVLLDIVPPGTPDGAPKAARDKFALGGLQTALKASPAAFYSPKFAERITTGNFEDDWSKLAECDWVIEVVVERLDIKRDVFKRLAEVVGPETIISSNTSGISLASMMEGMPEDFQRRFLITHFFNPPRYMKLMELVAGEKTDQELVSFMRSFFEDRLGKGVIIAKDTPNFVANRIGIYGMMATLKRMAESGLKVEEVDAVLGRASGRPKSAAFRTSDLVGLDTSLHVARNVYDNAPNDEERDIFQVPDWIQKMADNKWLGDKTGQGFYKKVKEGGQTKIQVLDPETMTYRDQIETPLADTKLEEAARRSSPAKRVETLAYLDDRAGQFAWNLMVDTLLYTANRLPEIADDILTVDNAMKWGYNWDLGIFDMWDAIGPLKSVQRMRKEGRQVPQWIITFINQGQDFFYIEQNGKKKYWDFKDERYKLLPENPNRISLAKLKQDKANVIRSNESASLINLGDGVLLFEFHAKMNSIDPDMIDMGYRAISTLNGSDKFNSMVVSNEANDFSVGANLFLALMAASQEAWGELEKSTKALQDLNMAIKFSPKPVVMAPFGRTLGGGTEFVLAGARVRAYAETYMGLVEVGVGLIPGGGGCKELLLRQSQRLRGMGGPFAPVQKAFETISYAKVSTSAEEARSLGFLRKEDRISLSRDSLLKDAKADALELANTSGGYKPPEPAMLKLPGEGGRLAIEQMIEGMVLTKTISEHDAVVANKLAYILTGGSEASPTREVSEQYILDLEREAFIQLARTPKTQERMQYMLMKGKPLRN
ncbi:MAG TPA: 3-hydroxyacyl-CoA dehydrogenase/enoyl-CoA hydratase family protein [Chloroflexia bacterium]|nr:3-hydroxyacyl-CoA dehydrogenase/enoyl-CoA hydratase family protein [Chloroflexia bacterium]